MPAGAGPAARPAGRRVGGYQRAWLVLYGFGVALSTVFFLLAATASDVPAEAVLATAFGWVAATAGTLMAADLSRRGIADVAFDEATSGTRVVALAWLLLLAIFVALVVSATGLGGERATEEEIASAVPLTEGLTTTLAGAAALLAVLGPGYSAYRSARAALDDRSAVTGRDDAAAA